MHKYRDNEFDYDNYEAFYEHHFFEPHTDEGALNSHELYPRVGWALDVARAYRYKTVLDLGCLEGNCVLTLAKNYTVNGRRLLEKGVGVDLSKEGIDLGRDRAAKYELPVEFVQGTLEDYMEAAIKAGLKFDMITAFEVMEHVKDPALVFKLMDQVLAPDGQVLISTPDFEAPHFGKNDEKNKCHIRLYTTAGKDYEAENKYGHVRQATSLSKAIGKKRIIEMNVWSELIHCRYS